MNKSPHSLRQLRGSFFLGERYPVPLPLPTMVPLEPHFKGEWWTRSQGYLAYLLIINEPPPSPSSSSLLLFVHLPPSPPLRVRASAVSAFSSLSPIPPPLHLFLSCLFQPIADRGHRFHWLDSSISTKEPQSSLLSKRWGEGEGESLGGVKKWDQGHGNDKRPLKAFRSL